MRRIELIRHLEKIPPFVAPDPRLEQVATPPEAAAELLFEALARGDLADRSVLDLGSGTGRLGIGAALLGAREVEGIDIDDAAVAAARAAAEDLGVRVGFLVGSVDGSARPAETVVMNPPFGAQRRHADRPFWETAFTGAKGAVYAFALADSRTFIARRAVAHHVHVEARRPVAWVLPRTFPHHRKPRVALAVDLWVLRPETKS